MEVLNNKIKVLKRKAYGYRDVEFFTENLCFAFIQVRIIMMNHKFSLIA